MIEVRHLVVDNSVNIEFLVSYFLGRSLDIAVPFIEKKLNPLPYIDFSSKVRMLNEMEGIDEIMKQKLLLFAEIRNALLHNMMICTFSDFFSDKTDRVNKLKKWFPDIKDADLEGLYRSLYIRLSTDLTNYLFGRTAVGPQKMTFVNKFEELRKFAEKE